MTMGSRPAYERLGGDRHRHGERLVHRHPHDGPHEHAEHEAAGYGHGHDAAGHGHSHGLIDREIVRSRAGLRAVGASLAILLVTAIAQASVYVLTGSVALLADLVHNFGDALTAVPLGIAFVLRSPTAERRAGLFVIAAILVSAAVALGESIHRLAGPRPIDHLLALGLAGGVGFLGNELAARVRLRAGRRLGSPALVADGNHARVDGYVSLSVVAGALLVALGAPIADPLVGLAITVVILRVAWDSWRTLRQGA
jgi:cation diffusion facilitator family transporter